MIKNWLNYIRPKILGFIVWALAVMIAKTLKVHLINMEIVKQYKDEGKGAVLVTWHGRTFIPGTGPLRKGKFLAMISLSRDGEIQYNIFSRLGFDIVRGSTKRGGIRAAIETARKVKEGSILTFTPDGPRGPSHKVQQGALFIAQKSGCPIIPSSSSAYPRKLIPTWDSYLIPAPFSKACLIFGAPTYVPQNATEEELIEIAEKIERDINELEEIAEAVAQGKIDPATVKIETDKKVIS